MSGVLGWIRRFIRELHRRRVIRVAVVYAGTAFVILQLGEILVEPFGLPGWTLRLVTFLLLLGFPLAVGLAWTFDVTEEGLVRTRRRAPAVEGGATRKPFTSNGLVVVLLVLAIGLFLYPRVFPSGERGEGQVSAPEAGQERSIAVLPFKDGGGEKKALGAGLADAIIAELSSSEKLIVVSRSSVMRYRGTELNPSQIGSRLQAEYVLDGNIQQAGGRIRVGAELIETETGRVLWAQTFDQPSSEIFEVQSKVALRVAKEVGAELAPELRKEITERPTPSEPAYQLYLRGQELLSESAGEPDLGEVESAIALVRQAIRLDSTFALAEAALSGAFEKRGDLSTDPRWNDSARVAARRALQRDPTLAEAHYRLGDAYMNQGKIDSARVALKRVLELNPGHTGAMYTLGYLGQVLDARWADALRWFWQTLSRLPEHPGPRSAIGYVMLGFGEDSSSVAWYRRALELGSPAVTTHVVRADFALGNLPAAQQHLNRYRAWDADHPQALQWSGLLAQISGDTTRALQLYRRAQHTTQGRAVLLDVGVTVRRAQVLRVQGQNELADSLVQTSIRRTRRLVEENESAGLRLRLAAAYQVAGDSAAARRWLEAAYRAGQRKHRAERKDPVWQDVGYAQAMFDRMEEDLAGQKETAKAWAEVEGIEWPPMPQHRPVAEDSAEARSVPLRNKRPAGQER